MKTTHIVALVLVIIGAINWGLVGLFQFDLVAALFGGQDSPLSRIVYTIVGVAGLALAYTSYTFVESRTGGRAHRPHAAP